MQLIAGLITESEYQEAMMSDEPSSIKEFTKNDVAELEELLKLLKQVYEKNEKLKAIPHKTLGNMVSDLEYDIKKAPTMSGSTERWNEAKED